jgi:uncharacterized protein YkwD
MQPAIAAIILIALSAVASPRLAPILVLAPAHVAGVTYLIPDDPPPVETQPDPGIGDESPAVDLPAAPERATTRPLAIEAHPEILTAPPMAMVAPELALLDETNRDRTSVGLTRVTSDSELVPLARARAGAQVSRPSLSHLDDGGALAFLSLIQRAGLRHQVAGENLVRLPGPIGTAPARAQRALMASPTHRANILDPRYGRLAIGMANDRDGRVIFAQLFRDGT